MAERSGVLVIGASAIDTKGTADQRVTLGMMNAGHIRVHVGGVARNIAENLARLGVPTTLLSVVGEDEAGAEILAYTAESGVDVRHVLRVRGADTATFVSLHDADGTRILAMYDMNIMTHLTARYVYERRRLFQQAAMVVIDANLPERTMQTVFSLAQRFAVPVCADPTSTFLAGKLQPYLPALYMITPDVDEARVLTRSDITLGLGPIELAKRLVAAGVEIAIVTMGEKGVCYATQQVSGHIPAIATEVKDLTGAGDAMTAAVVFGLLEGMDIDEAVRLGVSASSLTIRCRETVCPDLSLQELYDNLVI